jgi:hypothetical protein
MPASSSFGEKYNFLSWWELNLPKGDGEGTKEDL